MGTEALAAAEAALASDTGALLSLMADVGLGREPTPGAATEAAEQAGWIEDGRPTVLGHKVADSCREFRFWEERGRALPSQDAPEMQPEVFRDKDVVELGSGFGCNLLSLHGVARSTVGVEIEPIYVQLSGALSRRAGLPTPELVRAGAEQTGLEDASCDVVLSVGSIQYMGIERVLAETGRILRSHGSLIVIFGHLFGYIEEVGRAFVRKPSKAGLKELAQIPGMVAYPRIGRALMKPYDPVYPTHRRMHQWLRDAGFEPVSSRIVGYETIYVARKLA